MKLEIQEFVVGPEFTVPIPIEVRESLQIEAGQKVAWMQVGKTFHLVRVRSLEELRGSLPDFDWSDYRDETDRDL